ncbi:SMP-30/gluconolactonase/LRE family protein [Mycobacterium colombiense]|uniref:SMP-30/gluconolactonase/LRE family protein n=1 Tax=Mycobacterium colombiense TaxID=339268 RepID=UPI001C12AA1F|nr:SMP-30/gluconolactonase/LRE family protein [Mycobacterium colombiense]
MTMGEGPIWDVDSERLYWVDVFESYVYSSALDGKELHRSAFPEQFLSSLALMRDGRTMVTSRGRIYTFDLDSCTAELIFEAGLGPEFGFNDAVVDRQGRFITGMADMGLISALTSGQDTDAKATVPLYRVDPDLSVHPFADPIGVTNGPCFALDGKTFYCNDSASRTVNAWDYEASIGEATNQREVTRFTDGAIPDGTTVDNQGYLWIACYHAGEIRRIAPDGSLDRRIPVPVSSPTAVAFAGSELDVLVVTSRGGSSAAGDDGRVLALSGLGVCGAPENKFG